jgi:hypothetical protein
MSNKMLTVIFGLAVIATFVWYTNAAEAGIVYDGLISFWTFDEADVDGRTVKDTVGNNHGTMIGSSEIVEGKFGEGVEFRVSGDLVNCGDDPSLDLGDGDFTLEAWFKTGHAQSSYPSIILKGNPLCDGCPPGYAIYWYTGNFNFVVDASNVVGDADRAGPIADAPYMDDEWHQIVGVRDKDGIYLYLDGVQVAAGPNNERNVNVGADLTIGSGAFFQGVIDEVKIYNRGLSEEEVQQNFNAESREEIAVEPASKLSITWGGVRVKQ